MSLRPQGNNLGSFLESGEPSKIVTHILVELDLKGGSVEDIEIERGGRHYVQMLEYVGIPFKCTNCRVSGHLGNQCILRFTRRE